MIARNVLSIAIICTAIGVSACNSANQPHAATQPDGRQTGAIPVSIKIECNAFKHNERIPTRHTGDGDDLSPALSWSGVPNGASSLALICDDPDAPRPEPWVHWVIYRLPAGLPALPEGLPTDAELADPPGALQGRNSWGTIGYRGPAPPKGPVHHYHFALYALSITPELKPGLSKDELLAAIGEHVLARGELIGTYQR